MDASKQKATSIIETYEQIRSERSTWETHWQEVSDYVIPRKNEITAWKQPGEKKGIALYDTTGQHANELLAGALHGMLTNPSSIWFGLMTGDPTLDAMDEVSKYLEDCAVRMSQALNNTNFQTEIHEVYLDLGSIGTSPIFIEEDDESIFRFTAHHIASCVVKENHLGQIDSIYRCLKWTPRQVMQMFKDNAPKKIVEMAAKDPNSKIEIIHAIYPRNEYDNEKGPKNYRFESCWVWKDEKMILSEGGFREQPFSVPRWSKTTSEVYGRSPGMKALPDIKMVNKMMETTIRGAQKTVSPSWLVEDDGVVLPVNVRPDGLNFVRAGSQFGIKQLQNDARIDFGFQVMDDVRARIKQCFYVDQLQLQDGPQMTATEVMQRTEEKLRVLGPVLGRMQAELLSPMIDRIFAIMLRKGQFKRAPEVLQGRKINVEYTSTIAKAQRSQEGNNIIRSLGAIAPLININPSVIDNIDPDSALRFVTKVFGVPHSVMRDQGEVKKIRESRAQAEQQQMAAQNTQTVADAIGAAGPGLAAAKEAGVI